MGCQFEGCLAKLTLINLGAEAATGSRFLVLCRTTLACLRQTNYWLLQARDLVFSSWAIHPVPKVRPGCRAVADPPL